MNNEAIVRYQNDVFFRERCSATAKVMEREGLVPDMEEICRVIHAQDRLFQPLPEDEARLIEMQRMIAGLPIRWVKPDEEILGDR